MAGRAGRRRGFALRPRPVTIRPETRRKRGSSATDWSAVNPLNRIPIVRTLWARGLLVPAVLAVAVAGVLLHGALTRALRRRRSTPSSRWPAERPAPGRIPARPRKDPAHLRVRLLASDRPPRGRQPRPHRHPAQPGRAPGSRARAHVDRRGPRRGARGPDPPGRDGRDRARRPGRRRQRRGGDRGLSARAPAGRRGRRRARGALRRPGPHTVRLRGHRRGGAPEALHRRGDWAPTGASGSRPAISSRSRPARGPSAPSRCRSPSRDDDGRGVIDLDGG